MPIGGWLTLRKYFLAFCLGVLLASCGVTKDHSSEVKETMTVAAIRSANPGDTFVRVTFARSQRFYKLPNDADPKYLVLLKESEKNQSPVTITRGSELSDVILSVEKATNKDQ